MTIITFWSCYLLLFLLLILLFPAANVSYNDFCVKEIWSKGAELHCDEVSGGAGLGVDMGWYLLACIHWQEEEWTVQWTTGKGAWSSQHQWIWEAGENKKRRKKNAWKWHSAETNLVCLHWIGSSHPCPWSTNSQWWAVVYTWLYLRIFPSLQLCKYDWVLSRGRGQWLLGWVPPSRRAFWTLLIEVLSKMNWPGSVIQLQAQHGLVHSTNVLWKHIASSCSMAGPLLVMELRKLGKGKRVGLEKERGQGEEKWDYQIFFWFAVINSPVILAAVFIVRIKFF